MLEGSTWESNFGLLKYMLKLVTDQLEYYITYPSQRSIIIFMN